MKTLKTILFASAFLLNTGPALSQELKGFPDLRPYDTSIEFRSTPYGLMFEFHLDTDDDGTSDVVYIYRVDNLQNSAIYLLKPIGMMYDENFDNKFQKSEYHSLRKQENEN